MRRFKTCVGDGFLVFESLLSRLLLGVLSGEGTFGNVDVLSRNVDVIKEVHIHEGVIALLVVVRETKVLICFVCR